MDGSKVIFQKLNILSRFESCEYIEYPSEIKDNWCSDILLGKFNCILIGFSFGGVLAQHLARSFPAQVMGVIIINSACHMQYISHPYGFLKSILNRLPEQITSQLYRLHIRRLIKDEGIDKALLDIYLKEISRYHFVRNRLNILPRLWSVKRYPAPILWFHSKHSKELRFNEIDIRNNYPKAEIVTLNSGHRACLTHSDIFESEISSWFGRLGFYVLA